ncbi:hypothetical protein FRX31_033128 [Thalictrum thalictroides]|uniref:Uncharacterized protein n=1 Tax=Thalictrum thalictroides TaxID=46969 RepID=A0A7J6UXF6_THATH|nr:hypothetical protein FRX31_033128 [Thalictrum thalictroides]
MLFVQNALAASHWNLNGGGSSLQECSRGISLELERAQCNLRPGFCIGKKTLELENYNGMLQESSELQLWLKEQSMQTGSALKEELLIISDAFESVREDSGA